MLNTWRPRLLGAALVAVLAAAGCFNFDEAKQVCETSGNCIKPDGGRPCRFENDDDEPDDGFRDLNCDGVDGMADGGIFVDPVRGTDGAPGTADAPLRTLTEALDRARAPNAPKRLYLAQGAYNESGLVIDSQVALHGAYGGRDNGWERKSDFISFLDGGPVGLVIRDIGTGTQTVLDHLTVQSANPTVPGTASVALQVVDSQDIRLRYSTFIAGQGALGYTGDAGSFGPDGGAGLIGGNANGSNGGDPGLGGTSPCGGNGGDGQGGPAGNTSTASAGTMGLPGSPSPLGGQGGAPGTAGVQTNPSPNICRAGHGGNGETGKPGDAGTPGSSGMGMGELIGTQWVANHHGGNGTPGGGGGGGGGGGSGGSCYRGTVNGAGGAGSGGGGGGGCGGGAGNGGGGGGASIAVLLVRSNVQFEGDTVLRTLGGGRGGTGGEGGPGGSGGAGGPGGNMTTTSDPSLTFISYGGDGGAGGPGGNGGNGGPGGGGGGGPSVGIWCSTDAGYIGTPAFQVNDGGVGGFPGTGGNAGQPGARIDRQDCP